MAILSDNSVDHALLALGAMHAGIPVAPISPAYSLMSKDFGKLKTIFELVKPGLVWTADPERFKPALEAVGAQATPLGPLIEANPGSLLEREFANITPDSVAKILFTSGSTGVPKGVINTQRMLCANQQMLAQAWPFVEDRPPVVVDWLPWNHTFGGNHNFNLVLRNGGTLYVDGGKPAPGLIETTARNLAEIAHAGKSQRMGRLERTDMSAAQTGQFRGVGGIRIGNSAERAERRARLGKTHPYHAFEEIAARNFRHDRLTLKKYLSTKDTKVIKGMLAFWLSPDRRISFQYKLSRTSRKQKWRLP